MSNPAGPSAPQPYPGPSAPPPQYAPQPPKKKRTGLIILLVIVGLVGLLLFGSCVAVLASIGEPSGTAVKEAQPAASASDEPAEEPTEEAAPTTYTPKKSDWYLKIKTKDKQCFGSAGCNVEVRVTPLYAGPASLKTDLPDEGTIEITYKLTGDESGPITGTLVVDCSDQTAESNEESMSTRSSATKVRAKVTDIEYNEYG